MEFEDCEMDPKQFIFGIPLFDDEEINNDTCEEMSNGRGEDDE